MRYALTSLFALFTAAYLIAQASSVALHFDRPYHSSGEVGWFQVYLPQPAPPMVRAALYAPNGEILDYFFLESTDAGTAAGYLRWPYALETGYYRLAFSALNAGGELVSLGVFEHPVYNNSDRSKEAQVNSTPSRSLAGSGNLSIEANNGRVSVSGLSRGPYSISIVNADVTGTTSAAPVVATGNGATAYSDTLFYQGRVTTSEDGQPLNVNLLPVFDANTFTTYFSKSDAVGDFLLLVSPFEGNKEVQTRSVNDDEISSQLFFPQLPVVERQPPLTGEVLTYLDLSNRRRKIYQLYQTIETELDAAPTPEERRALSVSKGYDVQDYKAFPDMFTFFKEVAGELRYRERKGIPYARLYNAPNQRFFTSEPLYIVDGKLTKNSEYIARMSPSNVGYVGFYYDNRDLRSDFPALGSSGVVQIDLLRADPDFPEADAAAVMTLKGLQPTAEFSVRDEEGLPLLSPLLSWQTGTTEDGNISFGLPATDDRGNYRIVVTGRDGSGRIVYDQAEFSLEALR